MPDINNDPLMNKISDLLSSKPTKSYDPGYFHKYQNLENNPDFMQELESLIAKHTSKSPQLTKDVYDLIQNQRTNKLLPPTKNTPNMGLLAIAREKARNPDSLAKKIVGLDLAGPNNTDAYQLDPNEMFGKESPGFTSGTSKIESAFTPKYLKNLAKVRGEEGPAKNELHDITRNMNPDEYAQMLHNFSTSGESRVAPQELWNLAKELVGHLPQFAKNFATGINDVASRNPLPLITFGDINPSKATQERIKNIGPSNPTPEDTFKTIFGLPGTTSETLKEKYPKGI